MIKDVVEIIENPFDIGKSFLCIDNRTSISGIKARKKRERQSQYDYIYDEDLKRELRSGKTKLITALGEPTALGGQSDIKCSNCGNVTGMSNSFCPKCGFRLTGQTEQNKSRELTEGLQDASNIAHAASYVTDVQNNNDNDTIDEDDYDDDN